MSGITEVIDNLYISGLESASAILSRGIRSVINISSECPIQNLGPNMDYEKISLPDLPTASIQIYFDRLTDRIQRNLQQGVKTLVHCYVGRSRSASIILAYLMKYQQMSLREAFYYLRSRRPIIGPNLGFMKQLVSYERSLFGTTSVSFIDTALGLMPDIYLSNDSSSLNTRRTSSRTIPISRTASTSFDRTRSSSRPLTSSPFLLNFNSDSYNSRGSSFFDQPSDLFSSMNKPWLSPSESFTRPRTNSFRFEYPTTSIYNRYYLP